MVGIGQTERARTRGLSLVEALISLLILLTAVVGMAAAFQNRVFQTVAAKNQATAAMIAQTVANELMANDPVNWNEASLESLYTYDFEGNLTSSSADRYYWVDVDWQQVNNWYQVEIGVLWTGWQGEADKTGMDITDAEFAYVLDMSIAPAYGDTP